jgi:hypothetical protein
MALIIQLTAESWYRAFNNKLLETIMLPNIRDSVEFLDKEHKALQLKKHPVIIEKTKTAILS